MFYLNKEKGKFELMSMSKQTFDATAEGTSVIIALRNTNKMKPSTPRDELNLKIADPEHCSALEAREVSDSLPMFSNPTLADHVPKGTRCEGTVC